MLYFVPVYKKIGLSGLPSAQFETITTPIGSIGGMNLAVNYSNDDAAANVLIPFQINFLGTNYTNVYIGSNSYATFGSPSNTYSGINASNPPFPGIHVSAADNSYQRVGYLQETGPYGQQFRVRFEGNNVISGFVGFPTIVWELIFYQDQPAVIDVVIGANSRGYSGASGVTTGSVYLYTPPTPWTSYRITSE